MDGTEEPLQPTPPPPITEETRARLLHFFRTEPLLYGPWKFFKSVFKALDTDQQFTGETELFGVLIAHLDAEPPPSFINSLILDAGPSQEPSSRARSVSAGGFTFTIDLPSSAWSGYSSGRLLVRPNTTEPDETDTSTERVYHLFFDTNGAEFDGIGFDESRMMLAVWYGDHGVGIDILDPLFPFAQAQGPTLATILYMKRRARRALRRISTQRPEAYVPILLALWSEMGNILTGDALDTSLAFATMDALYAHSPRWKINSSGAPARASGVHFVRLRREERAPELWDANLDAARELYLGERVPTQVNEMALKVLRANKQEIPALSAELATRFVASGILQLQAEGTRSLAQAWEGGACPEAAQVADLLILGGGRTRGRARALLANALRRPDVRWKSAVADRMSETLGSPPPQSRSMDASPAPLTSLRRRRSAAQVLADHFGSQVSEGALWFSLEVFVSAGGRSREWALERVAQSARLGQVARLDDIGHLPEPMRDAVMQVFLEGARSSRPSDEDAFKLISKQDAAQNAAGWRLLASTAMESEAARALWRLIFQTSSYARRGINSPRDFAFEGQPNVKMWQRADFTSEETQKLIDGSALAHLSPAFFHAVTRSLAPDVAPRQVFLWLSSLRIHVMAEVLPDLLPLARGYAPSAADLVAGLGSEASWQFAAASDVTPEAILEVWKRIFTRISAFSSPAAAVLLQRAQVPSVEIALWFSERSDYTVSECSTELFAAVFELAPPTMQIEMALQATPERWDAVREPLLQVLEDEIALATFWRVVFDHPEVRDRPELGDAPAGALQDRFLSDHAIAASLERIPAQAFAELLASANPNHEPFLLRWLRANVASQGRSSLALIEAALHPVATIRDLGLARVREIGLSVPLALRLMESGLPQPFEMGRAFFESAEHGGTDGRDFALALCDSPSKLVRQFGREFLLARRSSLLDAKMLRQLSENGDAQTQAFVAEHLLSQPAQDGAKVGASSFDASILRARERARRAKEAVKARLQEVDVSGPASAEEVEALLDVARGRTIRDREWALQQLTRRALAGQDVPGLKLSQD